MSRAICWLRRDLRLEDQRTLAHATSHHDEVILAFVFDTTILQHLDSKNRRVTFIIESLRELDQKLRQLGSRVLVLHGDPIQEIPRISRLLQADEVICGKDYDPLAIRRDLAVQEELADLGIGFELVKDQVIFEAGEIRSQSDTPFRVFTPYSKRWLEIFEPTKELRTVELKPEKLVKSTIFDSQCNPIDHESIGFDEIDLWLAAGEDAAQTQLKKFLTHIDRYGEQRDFPAIEGGSFLSVHLRFGTISIQRCVREAYQRDSAGAKKWLMELIWREFYQDILGNNPEVVTTTYNPDYREMVWPGEEDHFQAWCEGKTGYPIVDAAMRCLNETGWMHNRLRMVVASFLTKDLLVDYRKGEKYFAKQLLDYELASNNGGWQWAASVGCDAQPYFRIFNPYLQSRKFDAEGLFIRQWVPELSDLDNNVIHCPGPMDIELCGYVPPIVHHDIMRQKAIALFEEAKRNSGQ